MRGRVACDKRLARNGGMDAVKKPSKAYRAVKAIAEWQKTVWYPVLFAVAGFAAASFGWQAYVPLFYVMAVFVVLSALFCDDIKVMLVPAILAYFSIGSDGALDTTGHLLSTWNTAGLVNMIIAGSVMGIAFIARFVRDGLVRDVFTRRGMLSFGFVLLLGAFLLNGVGSRYWQPLDLAMGLLEGASLALFYVVVLAVSNHTKGLCAYVCRLCLICGLMICAESWLLIGRLGAAGELFWPENGILKRDNITLGWGVANIISGTLVVLIAPTMYLTYTSRYSVFSYISAVAMFVTTFALNSRNAMLMGSIILVVSIIICLFGKNKTINRLTTLSLFCAAALVVIVTFSVIGFDSLPAFFGRLLRTSDADSGRFGLWQSGLRDYAGAPVFGTGFMHGAEVTPDYNAFSRFYHNMIVELLGATGTVGVLAFLVHIKGVFEICIRKFRVERLLIGLGVAAVIMASMLDNFYFYINMQLFYGSFLALAEVQLEETRAALLASHKRVEAGRKPRVVFTFVEAGMGHIVPEQAICDAFEKKYGNVTEVVRSRFYAETEDEHMKRFERGFVDAVKLQSRSRIFGKLCILGTKLAGNALSQQFVMKMRYPDSKADGRAMRHLRELNADVLFTTHWATAFYANKLSAKDGNRPYTVMFCPDAYSNGMFDIDCNDFLIPTKVGLAKAQHRRMYAGGRGTVVPYPIRGEAFALRGKKYELRRAAGIGDDEFVVLLADGGYGMAKLERTVEELLALKADLRIIAVCGKNEKGAERLRAKKPSAPTRLDVYGYADNMLQLVCMSDVFVGKSGANSMAEPTFFGMPIIITKCITPIESGIKKYYTKIVGNAMYIPDPAKAARTLADMAAHREKAEPYIYRARWCAGEYGADKVADLIYSRVVEITDAPPSDEYKVISYE